MTENAVNFKRNLQILQKKNAATYYAYGKMQRKNSKFSHFVSKIGHFVAHFVSHKILGHLVSYIFQDKRINEMSSKLAS